MSTIIIYFHGYNSSPNSDKVERLRQIPDSIVHAFPASVDPDVAIDSVGNEILNVLLDRIHTDDQIVFVGTSLGGWLASKLATMYDVPAILINPSFNPAITLERYDVPVEVRNRYKPIVPRMFKDVYFFAEQDDVIPNEEMRGALRMLGGTVFVDKTADHRFNGEPFEEVCKYIERRFK